MEALSVGRAAALTPLSSDIDALLRQPTPAASLTGWGAIRLVVRAASTFCLTTSFMLLMWTVLPIAMLGWSASAIESGSMEPAVQRGDIVVLRPVSQGDHPLPAEAVIQFVPVDGDGRVLHRVSTVDPTTKTYRTRGDANASVDGIGVAYDRVEGLGRLLVPIVGFPALWFREANWLAVVAVIFAGVVTVLPLTLYRTVTTDEPDRDRTVPLTAFIARPDSASPIPQVVK